MIDFEKGFGKWIVSVPDAAAVVCCEADGCVGLNIENVVSYLLLELLFCVGDSYRSFGRPYCCVDGGGVFFRNVGNRVPEYVMSHDK